MAATTATVFVNATPYFMSFTVTPYAWSVNSTGTGVIVNGYTYYSNPLGEMTVPSDPVTTGECIWSLNNTSSVSTNITINWSDFVNGDAMVNGNTGENGAATFGARSYFQGMNYSTQNQVVQSAASGFAYGPLGATTNVTWGLTLKCPTNAWGSGASMNSTVTVTMTGF